MNTYLDNGDPIDPEVQARLDLLRATPPRNPDEIHRQRQRFISELDSIPGMVKLSGIARLRNRFRRSASGGYYERQTSGFANLVFAVAIVVLLLIISGVGMTAYASQSALPGDTLYSLKTGIENTRVALSSDADVETQLNLKFAQIRLDEISYLIKQNRFEGIPLAANEFETYIQKAMETINRVKSSNPEQGDQLDQQVTAALMIYAQTLKEYWSNVPENTRRSITNAILTSEENAEGQLGKSQEIELTGKVQSISTNSWLIDGRSVAIADHTEINDSIKVGDQVKVHAFVASENIYIAHQIELADDQDIEDNQDDNDGGVSDESAPDNEQDIDDDLENTNDTGSEHGGDDGNGSGIDNSDDNGNDENAGQEKIPEKDESHDDSNNEAEPN